MYKIWLKQLFSTYGFAYDIFIPIKRSASFNTKFGFIRFLKRDEAEKAVLALYGIVIRNIQLQVNLAKYSGHS